MGSCLFSSKEHAANKPLLLGTQDNDTNTRYAFLRKLLGAILAGIRCNSRFHIVMIASDGSHKHCIQHAEHEYHQSSQTVHAARPCRKSQRSRGSRLFAPHLSLSLPYFLKLLVELAIPHAMRYETKYGFEDILTVIDVSILARMSPRSDVSAFLASRQSISLRERPISTVSSGSSTEQARWESLPDGSLGLFEASSSHLPSLEP